MITNQPSLAELLQAYKNNGAADAINAGTNGVVTGMNMAAQRAKAAQDQQNKLSELGIQKQTADAATKDAEAKYSDPADATALMHGGTPTHPITTATLDTTLKAQYEQKRLEAEEAARKELRDAALRQQAIDADQRSKDRQSAQRIAELGAAGTLAEKAVTNAKTPGFFASLPFVRDTQWAKNANLNANNSQAVANAAMGRFNALMGHTAPPQAPHSDEHAKAIEWAKANPNDPRSAAILATASKALGGN